MAKVEKAKERPSTAAAILVFAFVAVAHILWAITIGEMIILAVVSFRITVIRVAKPF